MAGRNLTLDDDAIECINVALIYGLQAYGEIERVRDAVEIRKLCGDSIDDNLVPLHITGDALAISVFADALRFMSRE